MVKLDLEFTDNTLVYTQEGVELLTDLLKRSVEPCLWAIKWRYRDKVEGISFHGSHKLARKFSETTCDSIPDGPTRLVNVSNYLSKKAQKDGYVWTNLKDFEDAKTYEGEIWTQ